MNRTLARIVMCAAIIVSLYIAKYVEYLLGLGRAASLVASIVVGVVAGTIFGYLTLKMEKKEKP